jgi:hypothetical protein
VDKPLDDDDDDDDDLGWEVVDWILLVQDFDMWPDLVNMVINLLVP